MNPCELHEYGFAYKCIVRGIWISVPAQVAASSAVGQSEISMIYNRKEIYNGKPGSVF